MTRKPSKSKGRVGAKTKPSADEPILNAEAEIMDPADMNEVQMAEENGRRPRRGRSEHIGGNRPSAERRSQDVAAERSLKIDSDKDDQIDDLDGPEDTATITEHPDPSRQGSEATPAGVKISESVQNRPASVQNRDLRPETRTRRGAMHETALVNVVRSLRQYGLTYGTIVNRSNGVLTKSTLDYWAGDVEPTQNSQSDGYVDPASSVSKLPPSSVSQPTSLARPPQIIDTNGEYSPTSPIERTSLTASSPNVLVENSENNGGSSSPVRVVVDPNSPYLQELLVQLLHLSAARNVPFKKYLETGQAVEDLRNASFAASLVPGETSEEFRRNLLSIAKKANLHDRYRTDAGLDGTEGEHS